MSSYLKLHFDVLWCYLTKLKKSVKRQADKCSCTIEFCFRRLSRYFCALELPSFRCSETGISRASHLTSATVKNFPYFNLKCQDFFHKLKISTVVDGVGKSWTLIYCIWHFESKNYSIKSKYVNILSKDENNAALV